MSKSCSSYSRMCWEVLSAFIAQTVGAAKMPNLLAEVVKSRNFSNYRAKFVVGVEGKQFTNMLIIVLDRFAVVDSQYAGISYRTFKSLSKKNPIHSNWRPKKK